MTGACTSRKHGGMPPSEVPSAERSAVIERAASVLFSFGAGKPQLSLGEIAALASLPSSTVRRLLVQLAEAGLVRQNPATHLYSLSLRLVQLGAVALEAVDIVREAEPVLRGLAASVGEAALLGQLSPHGVVYLAVHQPQAGVRVSTRAGDIRPANASSVGKALLAAMNGAELQQWLQANNLAATTPNAVVTAESLMADLVGVRERGYAINNRESSLDYVSVAASVHDHKGDAPAAVAISAPAYRISADDIPRLGGAVIQAARDLSILLGGSVPKTA